MAVEMDGQHGAHGAAGRAVDHDAPAHVAFLGEEVVDLGRVQPPRRGLDVHEDRHRAAVADGVRGGDRKSTRLNSSHGYISYAVFCLKKKKIRETTRTCTVCHDITQSEL